MTKSNIQTLIIVISALIIGLISIMSLQYKKHSSVYADSASLQVVQSEIKKGDSLYVYYYQSNCIHCQKVSPYLIPLGEKQKDKFVYINIQKHQKAWREMDIKETPTLIHYNNHSEVDRIEGEHNQEYYKNFFNKN
ncbi:thioredoxin family protein [Priestia megaterium]|uniref:thioredoxin family protein n=1 Tax=Priestia megaterium TaxID=1404 RepID=UPI000E2EFBD2|nr:thioredoxin family protein [Priestia megaterium]MED3929005.1 thioredoxin family protein [Priestia megaterium]RFB32613.1 thioredoxin [Bacillus sp. RC]